MKQLFGKSTAPKSELLHKAVVDKDWFWRNDYRMLNGVHVYGGRHKPYGNVNYPEEIEKIRQMTVLRDHNIWAISQGKSSSLKVADAKTRDLSVIKTNYKHPIKYLDTKEAMTRFDTPEGYKMELFASEKEFPLLQNPAQMMFDNKGRLWVSVCPSYPHYKPGDEKPDDKILIFEDTNGDNKADKMTVFADGLHMPIGLSWLQKVFTFHRNQTLFCFRIQMATTKLTRWNTSLVVLIHTTPTTQFLHSVLIIKAGIFLCEGRFFIHRLKLLMVLNV